MKERSLVFISLRRERNEKAKKKGNSDFIFGEISHLEREKREKKEDREKARKEEGEKSMNRK